MKEKKIHFPPIAVVIAAAVLIIVCFVIMAGLNSKRNQDEMFSEPYERTVAHCVNKEITSGSDGALYFLDLSFEAKDTATGGKKQVIVRISETNPGCEGVDQGSDLEIYYRISNFNFCHPAFIYPDYTFVYILLWIVIAACVVGAGMNIITIIRNKDGYKPKYEKPEDIGTLGEAGADSGLSDSKIDYSAGDVFSDKLMDSYVDPFATYTGYEGEQSDAQQGSYYDPNANASYTEPQPSDDPNSGYDQSSLNDPFASDFNNDPRNPYNMGSYETPASMFGDNSNYNSAEIYGDSSFGQGGDNNSTDIFGNSSFGADNNGR